MDPLG
jgi:transposase InsO family protein